MQRAHNVQLERSPHHQQVTRFAFANRNSSWGPCRCQPLPLTRPPDPVGALVLYSTKGTVPKLDDCQPSGTGEIRFSSLIYYTVAVWDLVKDAGCGGWGQQCHLLNNTVPHAVASFGLRAAWIARPGGKKEKGGPPIRPTPKARVAPAAAWTHSLGFRNGTWRAIPGTKRRRETQTAPCGELIDRQRGRNSERPASAQF